MNHQAQKQLQDAETEKKQLLLKIAMLEQEAQQKEKDRELQKQKETSKLEELLSKTLSRVDQLESSMQNVGNKTPPEEHERKVKGSGSNPVPAASSGRGSDDVGIPDESGDEESDDETFLTTPSGQRVPVTYIWWF